MRYFAELRAGKVVCNGSWDETAFPEGWFPEFAPPTQAIEITEATGTPAFGWTWNGTTFDPPPPPSAAEIQAVLVNAVQLHLDAVAKTRNYDGILSLCSYATSINTTFKAEGQAGVTWRDAVWAHCYQVMADVQAQTRTVPTVPELIAELPTITW